MSEVKVPELAESITEATITQWMKSEGDAVTQGEVLAELETDKVNMEIMAEQDGRLEKILRGPGETVQVGEVVAVLKEISEGKAASPEEKAPLSEEKAASTKNKDIVSPKGETLHSPGSETGGEEAFSFRAASPAARKLARERSIRLDSVKSHDPLGRISIDDIKASSEASQKAAPARPAGASNQQQATTPANPKPEVKPTSSDRPIEHIPMSRRRQTIANRLVQVQQNTAMLTTFNEVDMTAILDVRKRRQEKFVEQHGVKLGFMSFFTKAVIGALKAFPLLNAEIKGEEFLVKKFYDIGIAVAADEGLVVPVVREADRLSFAELEQEIANLAKKARDNKLSLSELQGGTFTITNGGIFGSLLSTPILNLPQVGILGMHKIQLRPVAIDKERMENRMMMYIALSYDHRIVDGKEAVSFLARVKELLEDPETLLLEG
ncbi:2-oxoglutarate dehydrogenase complex dihydrolipoyllysine-residue succinyltransferase [Aneurinibacillus tyrosinisolvens]|uniref:2-oxoglutarate dehydrogenase complex dihydrolipoyllysine-residue succinyltransferase n=1 Tax=Aneurinibacillus tyrosinisolvens TaxID=1443435 RepID=UPI00063F39F7|nr:2-oxoglutarate dehydrogenase complex dihydrolipoyllysine-residue succinyltransferase [Aneurinibacillus tyrosinisolvens]